MQPTIQTTIDSLRNQLATSQKAVANFERTTITIENYGSFAYITLTEPSEFWEGLEDLDTTLWTLSYDSTRKLPVNIGGKHLPSFAIFREIETRNYNSDMGNGTTLASASLLLAYSQLAI